MTQSDFKRISELRRTIPKIYEKVLESHDKATKLTVALTGMPHGTTVSSVVENAVVNAEMYYQTYLEMVKELNGILDRLKKEAMDKLTETEHKIVIGWYVEKKKMTELAGELQLTERRVYRVRKEAVNKLLR